MDLNSMIISEMFARAAARLPNRSASADARDTHEADESAHNGSEPEASVPAPSRLVSLFAPGSTARRIPALSAA
jgi:hypothetical protein